MQSIGQTVFSIPRMLDEALGLSWKLDGSEAEMAYPPSGGIPRDMYRTPEIHRAVIEIGRIRGQEPLNVMINRLRPGVRVPIHRDWIRPTMHQPIRPTVERWHLPIVASELSFFWCEGMPSEGITMPVGCWHGPVPYWLRHAVSNLSDRDRIHLVVDLDTPQPVGRYAEDLR